MRPRDFAAYLVDIEGVLVGDKRYEPVSGSVAWFNALQARGVAACLVTNNTTHEPADLLTDLRAAGFTVTPDQIVGVLELAVAALRRAGRERLLWLGVPKLGDWWRAQGFTLVTAGPCDAVVLGASSKLQVADLDRGLAQLRDHGADLVCLHRKPFWLDAAGTARLGPGAWAAALESAARPARVATVGKPEEPIYRAALERVGVAPQEALFISDDPPGDLVTAKHLGMATAFVLSGKYRDHAVLGEMDQADWPDVICARPADLAEALQQDGDPHRDEGT
jgi:4-nitrophenyl phosphatase